MGVLCGMFRAPVVRKYRLIDTMMLLGRFLWLDMGRLRLLHRLPNHHRIGRSLWQIRHRHHLGYHPGAHAAISRLHYIRSRFWPLGPEVAVRHQQYPVHRAGTRDWFLQYLQAVPGLSVPLRDCNGWSVWKRYCDGTRGLSSWGSRDCFRAAPAGVCVWVFACYGFCAWACRYYLAWLETFLLVWCLSSCAHYCLSSLPAWDQGVQGASGYSGGCSK